MRQSKNDKLILVLAFGFLIFFVMPEKDRNGIVQNLRKTINSALVQTK